MRAARRGAGGALCGALACLLAVGLRHVRAVRGQGHAGAAGRDGRDGGPAQGAGGGGGPRPDPVPRERPPGEARSPSSSRSAAPHAGAAAAAAGPTRGSCSTPARSRTPSQAFDALEEDVKANAPAIWERQGGASALLRAMAYLRMGEEQNCHQGNTPRLVPAAHPRRGRPPASARAPRAPSRSWSRSWPTSPTTSSARWLLNIAHMTLGSYPDGVPRAAPHPARRLRLGVSAAALPERGRGGRPRRPRPRRRRHPGRLRRRRPPRPRRLRHRASRTRCASSGTAATAPSRTARPQAGSWARYGRPQHHPGRLRQRRLRRTSLVLRGGWMETRGTLPAVAAAQRRRRHVRGRHRGRAGCSASLPRRPRPGSTTTATAGSTCSSATSRPRRRRRRIPASSSTTTATARSPTWRARRASTSWASSRAW